MGLDDYEIKILKKLLEKSMWLSTHAVTKLTGYSWETIDNYLHQLEREDFVLNKKFGDKNMWKFNFSKYQSLREEIRKA